MADEVGEPQATGKQMNSNNATTMLDPVSWCGPCQKQSKNSKKLRVHLVYGHGSTRVASIERLTKAYDYNPAVLCDECQRQLGNESNLQAHKESGHFGKHCLWPSEEDGTPCNCCILDETKMMHHIQSHNAKQGIESASRYRPASRQGQWVEGELLLFAVPPIQLLQRTPCQGNLPEVVPETRRRL